VELRGSMEFNKICTAPYKPNPNYFRIWFTISFHSSQNLKKLFLLLLSDLKLRKIKKNVYPVHKPAAVDYIIYIYLQILTLVNFYLLVILYGELLLKKAAIYVVKKVGLESHKEINILV
jgi:hypothetical protein